jgi:hypothetical protein
MIFVMHHGNILFMPVQVVPHESLLSSDIYRQQFDDEGVQNGI